MYINVMDVKQTNAALLAGKLAGQGILPHLDGLKEAPNKFRVHFGLDTLPPGPGLLILRGARQYGKSTWLEQQLFRTLKEFGPGSGLYLNGDEITDADDLERAMRNTVSLFPTESKVKRLFVDEITAVGNWEKAVKRLADCGELRNVLLITTGSKAADLRRGTERLPGRKGKLDRTAYYFTPVSFREFKRVCGRRLGNRTLPAYLMAGGCPIACNEIAAEGRIPPYILEMIRDWVFGECAATRRNRGSLLGVIQALFRVCGTPSGQAKIARESGLANNTLAAEYLEFLQDLLCVGQSHAWDSSRNIALRRKPAKIHFTNLLVALSFCPNHPSTIPELDSLPHNLRGGWREWAVAQELWRRSAIRGEPIPENTLHWSSKKHELDFVVNPNLFIEVKTGSAHPQEFAWMASVFPKAKLKVINTRRFSSKNVIGITLEDFLLEEP